MVRTASACVGDVMACVPPTTAPAGEPAGGAAGPQLSLRVVEVHGPWREEGEAEGVDVTVEVVVTGGDAPELLTMATAFETFGSVPLP